MVKSLAITDNYVPVANLGNQFDCIATIPT